MSLLNLIELITCRRRVTVVIFWLTGLLGTVPVFAETIELKMGHSAYQIELALTAKERSKGLMFRDYLSPDAGMLLVYRESGDHRIWMKNMQIPLQVFWINAQHRIVGAQRVEPCSGTPCPVYGAPTLSRFILELSDREHGIRVGDAVEGLRNLP